jgi:YidC/Oxa1 family membrane protein insertase
MIQFLKEEYKMKKVLFLVSIALFLSIILTGCTASPFPKVTETGVVVQVIARGRPMENAAIGVEVYNNTSNFITEVDVKLVSVNDNEDLKPFTLWKGARELTLRDVSKSLIIEPQKDAVFTFYATSYEYIDSKPYPLKVSVSYKDSDGKIHNVDKNSILEIVAPNGFYKVMRQLIEFLKKISFSYGIAIILLTLLLKLVTHPLTRVQFKSTAKMQAIQPEVKKLQEKYKNDPQKINQETMKLYKEKNVSMFGGCLPLLVQWPLLFVLFGALNNYAPFNLQRFLWLKDLNTPDAYYILPVLVFLSMFLQSKTSQLPGQQMDQNTKMMMYFLPVIFAVWAIRWAPSILIYWITFSLITIGEQYLILRSFRKFSSPVPSGKQRSDEIEQPKKVEKGFKEKK